MAGVGRRRAERGLGGVGRAGLHARGEAPPLPPSDPSTKLPFSFSPSSVASESVRAAVAARAAAAAAATATPELGLAGVASLKRQVESQRRMMGVFDAGGRASRRRVGGWGRGLLTRLCTPSPHHPTIGRRPAAAGGDGGRRPAPPATPGQGEGRAGRAGRGLGTQRPWRAAPSPRRRYRCSVRRADRRRLRPGRRWRDGRVRGDAGRV